MLPSQLYGVIVKKTNLYMETADSGIKKAAIHQRHTHTVILYSCVFCLPASAPHTIKRHPLRTSLHDPYQASLFFFATSATTASEAAPPRP